MPARTKTPTSKRVSAKFTIGKDRFAAISAVDGIELTSAMKKRAAKFEERGLSAAERRREIIRLYRES